MNRHLVSLGLAALAFAAMTACGGRDDGGGGLTAIRVHDGSVRLGESSGVSVVGCSSDALTGDAPVPGAPPPDTEGRLWINGAPGAFRDERPYTSPASVCVSDAGDVYIAGAELEHGGCERSTPFATLWKNGGRAQLGDANSYAFQVFAAGDDVYVAGYQECHWPGHDGRWSTVARLWVNGEAVDLSYGAVGHDEVARSVFVSDGAVYAAGFERDYSMRPRVRAKLWKNGEGALLDDGENDTYALSVYVSGGDVYVAGYEEIYDHAYCRAGVRAALWKNGERLSLGGFGYRSEEAVSVFVSDAGDVYVAGNLASDDYGYDHSGHSRCAAIWKNGEAHHVLDLPGSPCAAVHSVFVSDGVVYAAGEAVNQGSLEPVLWRDGAAETLGGGTGHSAARSVFVKK
jgi:hypothetical protein